MSRKNRLPLVVILAPLTVVAAILVVTLSQLYERQCEKEMAKLEN